MEEPNGCHTIPLAIEAATAVGVTLDRVCGRLSRLYTDLTGQPARLSQEEPITEEEEEEDRAGHLVQLQVALKRAGVFAYWLTELADKLDAALVGE